MISSNRGKTVIRGDIADLIAEYLDIVTGLAELGKLDGKALVQLADLGARRAECDSDDDAFELLKAEIDPILNRLIANGVYFRSDEDPDLDEQIGYAFN